MEENNQEKKPFYQHMDDGLMYLVNKGCKAWNWTTGRTNAELANYLEFTGAASIVGNQTYKGGPIFLLLGGYVFGFGAFFTSLRNLEIEKKEVSAAEKGLKDIEVEKYKNIKKAAGYVYSGAGGAIHAGEVFERDIGGFFGLIGWQLISLGNHIMRANYLPPQKSVFSRTKDKLSEMLKNVSLQPAQQTAFTSLPINYKFEFN